MKELLLLLSFFFYASYAIACSCAPFNSFCETKNNLFLYDVLVYGKVIDTNSLSIRIEKFELLEGVDNRDTLTVWNDTSNVCETLKAATLGSPGDTVFVLLDRIDSIKFSYDVIGDYRAPSLFCYQTRLKVQNDTVRGLINAVYLPPPPIPPFASFFTNIALKDFIPFLKSNNGSCIEIRDSTFDYIPLPEGQARWRENGNNAAGECWDQQYSLGVDTVIGNLSYQRINSIKVIKNRVVPNNCAGFNRVEFEGQGFYRNDIANKKVYYFNPKQGVNNDTLLYDFDLKIGDTLPNTFLYNSSFFPGINVSNIEFVFLGGKYRRQYEISIPGNGGLPSYLIEGVGFTSGLLSYIFPQLCCFQELECMLEENIAVYPDSTYNCQLITNLEESQEQSKQLILYPNPSNGKLFIDGRANIVSLEVFDVQGRKIKELNLAEESWDLPFEKGIYIVRIVFNDGEVGIYKVLKN